MNATAPQGYTPLFDPNVADQPFDPERAHRLGDRSPAESLPYVYDDDITLAVNVALAAGRPLLVRGQPGTGKSSLARSVAEALGWRFYPVTVSSRTAARDLLWSFDTVARLADAQALPEGHRRRPRAAYLAPGVLWWAFDRQSASWRGVDPAKDGAEPGFVQAVDPTVVNPTAARSVVLIDEIDKADPDVPNDLLVPLGSYQFRVEDGPPVVADYPPLVIVTTNEERELPRAFLRRCVILALQPPDAVRLGRIARAHFPAIDEELLTTVQAAYLRIRTERIAAGEPPPSVAEFLDTLASCQSLGLSPAETGPAPSDTEATPAEPEWKRLVPLLLAKMMSIPPEDR
jgi:MoxR-like ATPase